MGDAVMTTCTADPWWYQAVNWSLIIIGWLIINWQHNARETRKELRAELDKIYGLLGDIEEKSIRFHTGKTHDPVLMSDIINIISRLPRYIKTIDFWSHNIGFGVMCVRKSATYNNAEPSNFSTQPPKGKIVHEIRDSVDKIRTDLRQMFYDRYQSSLWKWLAKHRAN